MLPTNGWLAIAFETNNPGAWLLHCHIVRSLSTPLSHHPPTHPLTLPQAWHADDGFAVQFIESQSNMLEIAPLPADYDSQCAAWNEHYPEHAPYLQSDSGI